MQALSKPIPKFDIEKLRSQSMDPGFGKSLESFDSYRFVPLVRKDTLLGKINIDKLQQIRQMLRRRYTNKQNVSKVYHEWDHNGKGYVDEKDIHKMVNNLGIPIDQNEARVLLASADTNADAQLRIEEFTKFIFDENKIINVDLGKIAPSSKKFNEVIINKFVLQYVLIFKCRHVQMLEYQED